MIGGRPTSGAAATPLILAFRAAIAEVTAAFGAFLAGTEAGHATAAFVIIAPALVLVVTAPGAATGCFFRDGGPAGPTRSIEVFFGALLPLFVSTAEAAAQRLRLVETLVVVIPTTPQSTGGGSAANGSRFILEIGGTPRLLCSDAAKTHALVGEEHRGACQQELTELQDRIQPPALEEQNAAA